jgi:hypothetical protein
MNEVRIMLQSAKELHGYTIHARDGDLGKVRTLYFDDDLGCIHYLVADTGGWFSGKHVLLPAEVLGQPDRGNQRLVVDLTQEEVRQSPEVPKHASTSAYDATTMSTRAGRTIYWSTDPFVLQSVAARPASAPIPAAPPETPPRPATMQGRGAPLRSTRDVLGYYIQAQDGQIGHVEDFLIDPEPWHIRYLVIDTRNWLPGRKVLVSLQWVHQVSWDDMQVSVELTRDRIKNSPEYDPTKPLDRAYEKELFDFYGQPHYWE